MGSKGLRLYPFQRQIQAFHRVEKVCRADIFVEDKTCFAIGTRVHPFSAILVLRSTPFFLLKSKSVFHTISRDDTFFFQNLTMFSYLAIYLELLATYALFGGRCHINIYIKIYSLYSL